MLLAHLFSPTDLAKLDEKELEVLRNAVLHQIRTDPQLQTRLGQLARDKYNEIVQARPTP
jgi:hypothetical protein